MNPKFWEYLDRLIRDTRIVIDRPKGGSHPRYPELIYPLDYGFLENTTAVDGGGIDLWVGSQPDCQVSGILVTVDLLKGDSEIKLLLGCSQEDVELILDFTNSDQMQAEYLAQPD